MYDMFGFAVLNKDILLNKIYKLKFMKKHASYFTFFLEDGFGEIPVIYMRGGCKGYGRGPNKKNILNNLNMTVNKGEM